MKWVALALFVVCITHSLAQRCEKSEECTDEECCVNYAVVTLFGGICKRLRREGESCTPVVKESKKNPDMHHFQCPCKSDMQCVAGHEIKIGDHVIRHRPRCVVPTQESTKIRASTPSFTIPEISPEK